MYHLHVSNVGPRTRFIDHMKSRAIMCVFHYQPLQLSPVGRRFGGFAGKCPLSEHAGECLVRLPLFNTLSESDQDQVIRAVLDFTS